MTKHVKIILPIILIIAAACFCLIFKDSLSGIYHEQFSENVSHGDIKLMSLSADALTNDARMAVQGLEYKIPGSKEPFTSLDVKMFNEFPRHGAYHAVVRNNEQGHNVVVMRQPSKENNFELRIMINDTDYNAPRPVSFEIWAVPATLVKHPRNIVIITIDTLRPDRLGCYGYPRPTSPNLDKFAEQAVVFSNAFSTTSFTPPAHASIFTSKHVGDHGLLTWNRLPDDQLTLAEVLRNCGYVTAASINLHMLSSQNLGQGFDFYAEGLHDGGKIVKDGLKILKMAGSSPFLLWLHFYDVHRPYGRHPDWTGRFNPDGRQGVGDGEKHYNLKDDTKRKYGNSLTESGLSKADLQFIADRYDAGIAYVDAVLKPLLDNLSTPPRQADTMVVITSDHGENLLEHTKCLFAHDPFLNSVVTRIPLIIRYPGARGKGVSVQSLVSLMDIAPTVFDVIGVSAPGSFSQGKSLVPLTVGKNNDIRDEVFMECWGWEKYKAVRSENRLIILDVNSNTSLFFDLAGDPGEMSPKTMPQDQAFEDLYKKLIQFSDRELVNDEPGGLDAQTMDQLRSLGYIN